MEQLDRLNARASILRNSILKRAKKACAEAGLDADLMGIHPYNAIVSLAQGKPWPNVDYLKVRECIRLIELSWEPNRIVERWYKKNF